MPTPALELAAESYDPRLRPLLEGHAKRLAGAFPDGIEPDRLRRFLLRRAVRTLRQADSTAMVEDAEGRLRGLACWTTLG